MKLFMFYNLQQTAYGGAQSLCQAVLLVCIPDRTTTYDANGYVTSVSYKGETFEWEQGRKLVSGTLNGNNFTYAYDGNGMRFEKTVNGTTTSYYYNGTQLLMESKNGKRTWYIYGVTGIEGNDC